MSLVWLGLVAGCGDNAARTLTRIAIDPGAPKVPAGIAIDLAATYVAADLSTSVADDVIWQVADTGIAVVTPETGGHAKLLGVMTGTTMLSVSGTRGVAETFVVTVTPAQLQEIQVTPIDPRTPLGLDTQFTATGVFSDGSNQPLTDQVDWTSGAADVATVAADGKATPVTAGTATIKAEKNGVSGTSQLMVIDAVLNSITIEPPTPSAPVGLPQQLIARGHFTDGLRDITAQVTWSSDHDDIASVDADTGEVTAHKVDTAVITATSKSSPAIFASVDFKGNDAVVQAIVVSSDLLTIAAGTTTQFKAVAMFSDGTAPDVTTQATWDSDHKDVATISNATTADTTKGEARGISAGVAQISAAFGGKTGAATLQVTAAVLQSIAVTAPSLSITRGQTLQFQAIGTFLDDTTQTVTMQDLSRESALTWTSSDVGVAGISNVRPDKGLATALREGTTTITATFGSGANAVHGDATLQVKPTVVSIAIDPLDVSVPAGRHQQFTATATLTDGTTPDVTTQVEWSSSDDTIASVVATGAGAGDATAVKADPGPVTITATFHQASGDVTKATTLTVVEAVLDSIEVKPPSATVVVGATQTFTATGVFSDGNHKPLDGVVWTSNTIAIATVVADTGVATGVATGDATITAMSGDVSGDATLTVIAPADFAVSTVTPSDGVDGIPLDPQIMVVFNRPIDPTTLTAQTDAGPCTSSLQVSSDDFVNCVGFPADSPTMSLGNTVANATPAALLGSLTTYKVRVLATVTDADHNPLALPFTQAHGFTTVEAQVHAGAARR
jgi:uncharacterized protein YjdB